MAKKDRIPKVLEEPMPNAVGRGIYGTFNTKKDRYEHRKKMKQADPSLSFQPLFRGLEGRYEPVIPQAVHNVTGPVYTFDQLAKLTLQLKKSGRPVPEFHCIEQGKNAGKFRAINPDKPVTIIKHRFNTRPFLCAPSKKDSENGTQS